MLRYRRRPTVERSIGAGKRLVRALDAEHPVELAGSAPVVWELLRGADDADVVLERLLDRYADSEDVVRAGLESALSMLAKAGLIEVIDR